MLHRKLSQLENMILSLYRQCSSALISEAGRNDGFRIDLRPNLQLFLEEQHSVNESKHYNKRRHMVEHWTVTDPLKHWASSRESISLKNLWNVTMAHFDQVLSTFKQFINWFREKKSFCTWWKTLFNTCSFPLYPTPLLHFTARR